MDPSRSVGCWQAGAWAKQGGSSVEAVGDSHSVGDIRLKVDAVKRQAGLRLGV